MISDCETCWSTPCICGHNYRDWTIEALREQIQMLQSILDEKESDLIREFFGKTKE